MGETITIDSVDKRYGTTTALRQVGMRVEPDAFTVLLGPSGSGKSTLLRCVAGIEPVDGGTITIGGTVVAGGGTHLPPERRGLAMVFQDYALWPHMTARENVAFALRRTRCKRVTAQARADEMLARVGLPGHGGRYPNQLSGGEQQRVALARALVAGTGLVLFDEPLSNLDADLRERMRIEISSLVRAAGASALYITHDQAEAFALADRVGVLDRGRLVQVGAPEDVYRSPATAFVARFTGLSGELPGRIIGSTGGDAGNPERSEGEWVEATVESRSGVRPLRARLGVAECRGPEVSLMIRPTSVRLCPQDDDECHLAGSVADVAFRGRGYEHAVELDGGTRLTGIFHGRRFARGERVGVAIDHAGCIAFPMEEPVGRGTAQTVDGEDDGPSGAEVTGEATTLGALALTK